MDNILNKIINIVSKEESKTQTGSNTVVKITDQDGVRYMFFKKKNDGNLSSMAEQFRDMGLDEGSNVSIGYVVDSYKDKTGQDRTSNKIIGFREATTKPVQTTIQDKNVAPSPSGNATGANTGQNRDASIIRQVAFKGIIELVANGKAKLEDVKHYTDLFEKIITNELTGKDKFLANGIGKPEELPVIQQEQVAPDIQEMADEMAREDDGVRIEDIPFN